MTAANRHIASLAIAAVRWNYLGALISSACSLTVGILLARMLGPRPYGQTILAATVYGFVNLLVDGGFSQALVQMPVLEIREIRRTFTWQIALSAKATGAVYLLAPWIACAFRDPSATRVIQVMSVTIVLQSFGWVSAALLRRQMKFKLIQCAGVTSYLVGFLAVGLPLAYRGAGVWSLVAAYLCQSLLNSLLLYLNVRHSLLPSLGPPARSTSVFGATVVANNLVNWGHGNLDNLAAAQLGPLALGLYGRACNLSYQPANAFAAALQPVLMSTAARAQQRQRVIRDMALCLMAVVFGLLGCAYAVLALVPDTVVLGLFGDRWMGATPAIAPLALAMPFYGAHCLLGPIICGLGKPALEFWPQAISCAIGAAAFFMAGHYSIVAVAWTLLAVMLLRFTLLAAFAFQLLDISWVQALTCLRRSIAFSALIGALAWSGDQILRSPFHLGPGLRLMVVSSFCCGTLGWVIWTAGELLFGHEAIAFLSKYAQHLPEPYASRVRMQAGRRSVSTEAHMSSSVGVAG